MSEANVADAPTPAPARSTPLHLWIVGVLALLWNAMGAYDYLMTKTENADYMARFTQEQLDYFYGFPAWATALWAIAVWGAVLGSILLLLRKGAAAPVFLVSFAAMVVTTVRSAATGGFEIMGSQGAIFSAVIFVVALALWLYARAMRARGVLR